MSPQVAQVGSGFFYVVKPPSKAGIKAQRGVGFENDAGEAAWQRWKPGL